MTKQQKHDIGQRLQAFRNSQGLTQEQMAEKLEITPKFLGTIERGEKSMSITTLIALLEKCNADINYILSGRTLDFNNPYGNFLSRIGTKDMKCIEEILDLAVRLKNGEA